jgi:CHAT domain-containing protein
MQAFYRQHIVERQSPAEALHSAQLWLRQAKAQELGLKEHWERVYRESNRTNMDAFRAMRYYSSIAQLDPDLRPFTHPYYWAAFTVNGL